MNTVVSAFLVDLVAGLFHRSHVLPLSCLVIEWLFIARSPGPRFPAELAQWLQPLDLDVMPRWVRSRASSWATRSFGMRQQPLGQTSHQSVALQSLQPSQVRGYEV